MACKKKESFDEWIAAGVKEINRVKNTKLKTIQPSNPAGCVSLEPDVRVGGPFAFDPKTAGTTDAKYVLMDLPNQGRMWIWNAHVEFYKSKKMSGAGSTEV